MPSTIRSRVGLIAAFDPSAVPDNTELNGHDHWVVFENGGPGNGIYKISGGEIVSNADVSYALALWGKTSVGFPGQCVRADVMSPNWADLWPGLAANGALDHSENTQAVVNTSLFELRERSGADYGGGFPITTGSHLAGPLTNGVYYPLLLASVQNPGSGFHARGALVLNGRVLVLNDSNLGLGTGINDGSNTYPGLNYWHVAGMHWKNYKVYKDYRLTVNGLSGTQAFRLYDAGGSPIGDSGTQSGSQAHVNIHAFPWPITGHVQVFANNTYTPGQEVAGGRFPSAGNDTNIVGGDVLSLSTIGAGIQWNYNDDPNFPGEWFDPIDKDVTLECVEYDLLQMASNPRIEVDTATIILRDPAGKYVPARTTSPLYPNLRLGRWIRMVFDEPEGIDCRFVGKTASIKPVPFNKSNPEQTEQWVEIRAESPMREIASSAVTLNFPFVGPLVNADGSGVISSILDLIADIIPLEVRQLSPTPDVIPEGFLSVGMTVQTALEQCAIFADSIYLIRPNNKTSPDQVNYYFIWTDRDSLAGQAADHDWVDTDDDIHEITPDFSADVL